MTADVDHEAIAADLDRRGFAIVPGFLRESEVLAGRAELHRYFPTADEFFAAAPKKFAWLQAGQFAGLVDFPFVGDTLNDHVTHPRLVALARRLIGADDVRLVQARAWAKYGGNVDFDQEHHRDYLSHDLAFPSRKSGFREVIGFIYYSDVTEQDGCTRFVSNADVGDLPPGSAHFSREARPDLYEREVPGAGPAGSLVLYTPLTFHRGAALGPPPAYRWLVGMSFRGAGVEWVGNQFWPPAGVTEELQRFITRATVEQRTVLGFPPPGSPYWDDHTREGVAARYHGIDMRPYQ